MLVRIVSSKDTLLALHGVTLTKKTTTCAISYDRILRAASPPRRTRCTDHSLRQKMVTESKHTSSTL